MIPLTGTTSAEHLRMDLDVFSFQLAPEEVENIGHLAQRVSDLFQDNAARKAMGEAGLRTVERLGGALGRTMSELEPYLLQLRLLHQAGQASHA